MSVVPLCAMEPNISELSLSDFTYDIFDAVRKNSIKGITYWLNHGVDINSKDKYGNSALMIALEYKCKLETIKALLDKGIDTEAKNKYGNMVLMKAVMDKSPLKIISLLLDKGANIETKDEHGLTVLMKAVINKSPLEIINLLLDKGANIEAKDEHGLTVLMKALIHYSPLEVIKMLIDKGANVEAKDKYGNTVVMQALKYDSSLKTMKLLLGAQPNINDKNADGDTALMTALNNESDLEIVKLLLDARPNINDKDADGHTALMIAIQNNSELEIIKALLDAKPNLDIKDKNGDTALIMALRKKSKLEIIMALLNAKPTIENKDEKGNTALMVAIQSNCKLDIISTLLNKEISIEAKNNDGATPLIIATQMGNLIAVKELLDKGADIEAVDNDGNTALQWAQKNKYSLVEDLIRDKINNSQKKSKPESSKFERAIRRMRHIHRAMNPQKEQPTIEPSQQAAQGEIGEEVALPEATADRMEEKEEEEKKEHEEDVKIVQLTPTEVHFNTFKNKITDTFGKHIIQNPIVQKCIERERAAYKENNYVFYRSEPGTFIVLEDFIKEVYRLVQLWSKQDPFIITRFFKKGALERTITDYIKRVGRRQQRGEEPNVLLSANIPLFGNINNMGSCTWDYFIKNKSVEKIDLKSLFESIFSTYGFGKFDKDNAYINNLLAISKETENFTSLQQIIIPKKIIDDVAMLAEVGYFVPLDEKLSFVLENYTKPDFAIKDEWQVRLLMNTIYGLNPESGITFYSYHDLNVPEDLFARLNNKVKKITDELFSQWLIHYLDKEQLRSGKMPQGIEKKERLGTVLSHLGKGRPQQEQEQLAMVERKAAAGQEEEEKQISLAEKAARQERVAQAIAIRHGWRASKPFRSIKNKLQKHEPASVWKLYVDNNFVLDSKKIVNSFMQDCNRDAVQNNFIPQKQDDDNEIRIATYNVHKWTDPQNQHNLHAILDTIKSINADVLVLQEVILSPEIEPTFKLMGYPHQAFMSMQKNKDFGNMIISRYPFAQEPIKQVYVIDQGEKEERNFINTHIQLPTNKIISVYGTHLDVWDKTGQRRMQEVQELVATANKDPHDNVLLIADWNAVREKDYQYMITAKEGNTMSAWDVLNNSFIKRINDPAAGNVPIGALKHIENEGFKDSFAQARMSAQQRATTYLYKSPMHMADEILADPTYTVWTGTVVDFIFSSPRWNLPVAGSYVYYSTASDHLPVIMDIRLQP